MDNIACQNGAYCRTKKRSLNISHWYSIFYTILLFSAYLRLKECPVANSRLFFGVEQKTPTEKSKSGYNPKVAHIAFLSAEEKALKYTHNICCPVKAWALLFFKKQTSDKTTGRTAYLCSTPGCSTYSISVISFL